MFGFGKQKQNLKKLTSALQGLEATYRKLPTKIVVRVGLETYDVPYQAFQRSIR